jgi:hypothetical protein
MDKRKRQTIKMDKGRNWEVDQINLLEVQWKLKLCKNKEAFNIDNLNIKSLKYSHYT